METLMDYHMDIHRSCIGATHVRWILRRGLTHSWQWMDARTRRRPASNGTRSDACRTQCATVKTLKLYLGVPVVLHSRSCQ